MREIRGGLGHTTVRTEPTIRIRIADGRVEMSGSYYEGLLAIKRAVRRMAEADDRHGTGFYNDPEWRAAYDEARRLVGREVGGEVNASAVMQDHMAQILCILGLGDHARPESPAAVMEHEIIPEVQRRAVEADRLRKELAAIAQWCETHGDPRVRSDLTSLRGERDWAFTVVRTLGERARRAAQDDEQEVLCEDQCGQPATTTWYGIGAGRQYHLCEDCAARWDRVIARQAKSGHGVGTPLP